MRTNKKIDLWMCPTLLCVLLLVSVSLPARNSSILANLSSKDSIVGYWSLDPLVCDYVVKAVIVPHESSESGIKKMVVKRFRLYDNTGEPLILIDGEEAGMEYFNMVNEAGKIKSYSTMKGEDAVGIYGEKAKNGVLLLKLRSLNDTISYRKAMSFSERNGALELNNDGKTLMIINGKETKGDILLENIPVRNIKNFTVLKGRKAIEMFGEKGRNGVIIMDLHSEKK